MGAEGRDLTFERAVKIARRVDPSEEESHYSQGVSKKAAHTVTADEMSSVPRRGNSVREKDSEVQEER